MVTVRATPVLKRNKLVCQKCGKTFVAVRHPPKCPECRREERLKYLREYGRKRFGKVDPETNDKNQMLADQPVLNLRCKFCGKHIAKGSFCKSCSKEGFDNVYLVTGRSNGWDRRPHVRVPIPDGWRGRECSGTIRPKRVF